LLSSYVRVENWYESDRRWVFVWFFDEKSNTVVPLVKTVKNTEQVIGPIEDFEQLTSNNTHAPKYNADVDYCAQVEELLEIGRSNGSIEPNTPYILRRDSSR
jgi:hypothetical protein